MSKDMVLRGSFWEYLKKNPLLLTAALGDLPLPLNG